VALTPQVVRATGAIQCAAANDLSLQIRLVATAGMYGDLQGIAGKTLREVEGLQLDASESAPQFPEGKPDSSF
jgi:hypothetical protein